MQAALKAVEEGESISKAARDHGIPKTTLFDRTSGRVAHGTKPGPRPYLNSEEEKELATYLKHCAMKERKRKEREGMKKKREDEQRKKSQERVRKAELRAKQKAEKEAQKVQRTQKAKAKVSQTTNAGAKGSDRTRTTRKAKCARTDTNCEADFNDSECCVCFVPYEEDQSGKDWVACGCGR